MTDPKGLPSHDHLKTAFAREAGHVGRYLYFARIAEIEGFPGPAQLFRDLAESCLCNAHGHLDFLKRFGDPCTDLPIGESGDNLLAAIAAVTEDGHNLYPEGAEAAGRDGFADLANWFATMARTSRSHGEKLHRALSLVAESLGKEGV
jgi:rubrerythrin